mmetsp:Transcript_10990/g.45761  ORF Transcript_10990/g.45761 Transcript_10990/m.45761 type:complete len:208 (-) Transcript_10990:2144-2767(-)
MRSRLSSAATATTTTTGTRAMSTRPSRSPSSRSCRAGRRTSAGGSPRWARGVKGGARCPSSGVETAVTRRVRAGEAPRFGPRVARRSSRRRLPPEPPPRRPRRCPRPGFSSRGPWACFSRPCAGGRASRRGARSRRCSDASYGTTARPYSRHSSPRRRAPGTRQRPSLSPRPQPRPPARSPTPFWRRLRPACSESRRRRYPSFAPRR